MVYILTVASLVFSAVAATDIDQLGDRVVDQLKWQADYGKALAATRSNDRPLLVVLDVPADAKSSIPREQVDTTGAQGKLLNSYQLCRVDVSTKYGQKVAQVFKADKFPFTAIIDKTGSVVLCKKNGQLSSEEWEGVLATYQQGKQVTANRHTSAYRGGKFSGGSPSLSVENPSYCPSCQKRAQQNF